MKYTKQINNEITDHYGDDLSKRYNFIGKALVYDEEIFINTCTGHGYDAVIKKMKNYIDWYSCKIRLAGFEREDIKQLIILMLLDGIRRYNPKLNIKLSTFLYVHIKNRMISRIKEETRQSLNATYNEPFYKFICICGHTFVAYKEEGKYAHCVMCKHKVDNTWTVRPEHVNAVSLDAILTSTNDDERHSDSSFVFNSNTNNNLIDFFGKIDTMENVEKVLDFSSVLRYEDDITRKIADLIYNKDYSITDAANEVGLTCWAASLRLKHLKNKKHIKDFFLSK